MPIPPPVQAARLNAIDWIRGVAMLWMTLFHFCFDLNYFGWWKQDFVNDPAWTLQRSCIVGIFVFCAGLGQAVAHQHGLGWARFWRRWLQIVACVMLVTIGSWSLFPHSFIYFGVLHAMVVMLLVARLTAGWGWTLWPMGLLAILAPFAARAVLTTSFASWAPLFDSRALNWLGLITRKPYTEDFVPLLPWMGIFWWGVAAGTRMLKSKPEWLNVATPPATRALVFLGRYSLSYYMLHQPVIIGVMGITAWCLQNSR